MRMPFFAIKFFFEQISIFLQNTPHSNQEAISMWTEIAYIFFNIEHSVKGSQIKLNTFFLSSRKYTCLIHSRSISITYIM
jgi:hypothetical protein